MASVQLTNVVKEYPGGNRVVHGINLDIKDGEFMVLVGPSGCGKSTTLRMIAGLEDISAGEIRIKGAKVNDTAPKDRNISMVFQNYALYPHMTVHENIAFGLRLAKFSKEEVEKRIQEVAKMLEIEHLLSRKPKEMSGGQRQRVALGRAIARRPQVFLFDEPLSNLDAKLRVSMRVRLAQLHEDLKGSAQGNTMIYVTHDQVEAMTLGHRICVMESGYIRQVDTPMDLYQYPANKFVAEFIGSPAMNFTQGRLSKKESGTCLTIQGSDFILPAEKVELVQGHMGKDVAVGLRSEHISVSVEPLRNSLKSKIDIIEKMGNEEMIYFYCGETLFIAREQTGAGTSFDKAKEYFFAFDMDNVHLFDLETEQNISLPPSRRQDPSSASVKFDFTANAALLKKYIGGSQNIKDISHCVTRVRISVHKNASIDQAALKALGAPFVVSHGEVHFIAGKHSDEILKLFQ